MENCQVSPRQLATQQSCKPYNCIFLLLRIKAEITTMPEYSSAGEYDGESCQVLGNREGGDILP